MPLTADPARRVRPGSILIHHTGAVAVAACHTNGALPDPRFPCWIVIIGAEHLGDRGWLTGHEITADGRWKPGPNLFDLLVAERGDRAARQLSARTATPVCIPPSWPMPPVKPPAGCTQTATEAGNP